MSDIYDGTDVVEGDATTEEGTTTTTPEYDWFDKSSVFSAARAKAAEAIPDGEEYNTQALANAYAKAQEKYDQAKADGTLDEDTAERLVEAAYKYEEQVFQRPFKGKSEEQIVAGLVDHDYKVEDLDYQIRKAIEDGRPLYAKRLEDQKESLAFSKILAERELQRRRGVKEVESTAKKLAEKYARDWVVEQRVLTIDNLKAENASPAEIAEAEWTLNQPIEADSRYEKVLATAIRNQNNEMVANIRQAEQEARRTQLLYGSGPVPALVRSIDEAVALLRNVRSRSAGVNKGWAGSKNEYSLGDKPFVLGEAAGSGG